MVATMEEVGLLAVRLDSMERRLDKLDLLGGRLQSAWDNLGDQVMHLSERLEFLEEKLDDEVMHASDRLESLEDKLEAKP